MEEKRVLKRRKKYRRERVAEMKASKSPTKSNLIRFPYVEQAAKKWNKAVGKIAMDQGWGAVPFPDIYSCQIAQVLRAFQHAR